MKRSGTTETTFVLVCAAVLLAAYGIGLGIREIRFKDAREKIAASQANKPTTPVVRQTPDSESTGTGGWGAGPDATFNRRSRGTEDGMGETGRRFGNMSEEDISQFRDRFSRRGRRGNEGFDNSSEGSMDDQMGQMRGGRGGRGGMQGFGGEGGFEFGGNNFQPGDNNFGPGNNDDDQGNNNDDQGNNNNDQQNNDYGPGEGDVGPGDEENSPGDNDL